jgi:hypothetical protein
LDRILLPPQLNPKVKPTEGVSLAVRLLKAGTPRQRDPWLDLLLEHAKATIGPLRQNREPFYEYYDS